MGILREKRVAILLLILLGVLFFGYRAYRGNFDATVTAQSNGAREDAIPTVSIIHAKQNKSYQTITLPGNITGWYEATIYSRVEGYVKMWYKDYGAEVKEGDLLAEILTPSLDARYRKAKADLVSERARYALAEVSAKRYLAMRKVHAVAEQAITVKVQEARAQGAVVNAAEQEVRNYEAMIGFKKIRAPFDGVVTERNINVGAYANKEGSLGHKHKEAHLFTVAKVDKLRLFVSVPQSFGPFLKPGLTADVTVLENPKHHFTAKFLTVSKGFDIHTRTAVTVFTIDNKDRTLWPGSYATVRLTAPPEDVLFIPSTALVFQEHASEVAVVTEDNRLHFKPITVGRIHDEKIEVIAGISTSDRIVNSPDATLLEGTKVRIVTPAPGYDLINSTEAPAPKEQSSTVTDN